MIAIIDYRTGNLGSIRNMLKKMGKEAKVTSDPRDVEEAEKLILPGVGAFDMGMGNLRELGLVEPLNRRVLQDKVPILGICLGMQLMSKSSEEGNEKGLGWLEAKTIHFKVQKGMKIPNMGWNSLDIIRQHPLVKNVNASHPFYFVHSYHVLCEREEEVVATSRYGIDFTAIFAKENVMGTQFHPEKSLRYGLNLLKNFVDL